MKRSNMMARRIGWLVAIAGAVLFAPSEIAAQSETAPIQTQGAPARITILDQNGRRVLNNLPSVTSQIFDVTVGPGGLQTFSPAALNISVGDTVRWTWDSIGHSVTSGQSCAADSQFCSPDDMNCPAGVLSDTGTVYLHTFSQAGTYVYFCVAHCVRGMVGSINVTEGSTPTPSPSPTATFTPTATATATASATATPIVTPTVSPGSPTPTATATAVGVTISGTVSYCPSSNPVPGVTMTISGNQSGTRLTDSAGFYMFTVPPGGIGNYTVTPTKAARLPGSANINTQDVIATQRHFLGLGTPLSGCRLTAADVNGDTLVNTSDVIAIQRFFLGLSTGIANVGTYQFNPVNRSYSMPTINQTGQNFDALILGDVAPGFVFRPEADPSQDEAGARTGEVASTVAVVALPNVAVDQLRTLSRVKSGNSFTAAVTTSAIDEKSNLVGFQGDFTFDERVVTFQSEPVQKAGLTAGNWNVSGNVLPGTGSIRTLRVSAFSLDFAPLSGSGTLFELRMARVSKATRGTQLLWAAPPDQFIFIDADLNTQIPGYAAPGNVDGRVRSDK